MARETILNGGDGGGDEEEQSLRPKRLADLVGQRNVVERLEIAVSAALQRGEALGHVLFDGPPGLGKTTLALCVPREMSADVQIAVGPGLKAPKDLIPYLTNLQDKSVLFIDEIHRIPKAVEEFLYTAMEDYRIDIVLGEGVNARTLSIELKPFTLIGATTRAGMLSGPLRDRFQIREHLDFYEIADLTEIVRRNGIRLNIPIDAPSCEFIAERSRSTPRIAINLLRWARDYAQTRANGSISKDVAAAALNMAGVDELGLNRLDRQYLATLIDVFSGGPTGIEALAHTMNTSLDTLQDEVEPFLLRSKLVIRSPRGRMATVRAYDHLGVTPPPPDARPQGGDPKSGDDDGPRLF